jgi:hypothetical protein
MIVQKDSLREVIEQAAVPVVAGGRTRRLSEEIEGVDHFVLDEVENSFSNFCRTLRTGRRKNLPFCRETEHQRRAAPRYDRSTSTLMARWRCGSRAVPFDCSSAISPSFWPRAAPIRRAVLAEFVL